jgi:hypothetical protein
MKNLRYLICLMIFAASSTAFSVSSVLTSTYERHLLQTRSLLQSSGYTTNTKPTSCHQQLLNMSKDGRIHITMAFGYMDVSGHQETSQDSNNALYGIGDVLDQFSKAALESVLKESCGRRSNPAYACGFKKRGNLLVKQIKDRFTGKRTDVTIQMVAASASSSDYANKNQYSSNQSQSSAYARSIFMNGFRNSDAVIYMGHARSGGGPDFYPPVLYSNGAVNYSHYKSKQQGIRDVLGAISGAHTPVVGILACNSTALFSRRIKSASPSSIVVTADALFDYSDIVPTGFAMIEAIVSQRCTNNFDRIVRIQPNSSRFIHVNW